MVLYGGEGIWQAAATSLAFLSPVVHVSGAVASEVAVTVPDC